VLLPVVSVSSESFIEWRSRKGWSQARRAWECAGSGGE
jgi:hypothetical protein